LHKKGFLFASAYIFKGQKLTLKIHNYSFSLYSSYSSAFSFGLCDFGIFQIVKSISVFREE